MPRPALLIDWHHLPWSQKNNAVLSKELGCSTGTVEKYRAIHAPDTVAGPGRPVVFDFTNADFTMRDEDIAYVWGCSRDLVKKYRGAHDVPACTNLKPGGRPPVYAVQKFDPAQTASWNAQAMGCTYQNAWQMLKNYRNRNN